MLECHEEACQQEISRAEREEPSGPALEPRAWSLEVDRKWMPEPLCFPFLQSNQQRLFDKYVNGRILEKPMVGNAFQPLRPIPEQRPAHG